MQEMATQLPSMALPDGAIVSLIGWLYLVTNAIRLFTYIPQVIVVWRCSDGAQSVSLLTWGSWVLSHITAVFYGLLVVHDRFFIAISLVNLVGCGAVAAIAMRRRSQWRRSQHASYAP